MLTPSSSGHYTVYIYGTESGLRQMANGINKNKGILT